MKHCQYCPLKGTGERCRRDLFPWFCGYASTGDPVRVAVVANRSRIANGNYKPRKDVIYPERTDQRHDEMIPIREQRFSQLTNPSPPMISDNRLHQIVYDASTKCPHRVESKSCCSPDTCGPEGERPGEKIGIGVCYPCQAARLGIVVE